MLSCKAVFTGSDIKHKFLSSDEMRRDFAMFDFPSNYEAVYDCDGGLLFPDKSLNVLWDQIRKGGGKIADHEPLVSVDSSAPGKTVVKTNKQTYTALSVVLCLGPWTRKFVKNNFGLDLNLETHIIHYYYARDPKEAYQADKGVPTMNMIDTDDEFYYSWPAFEYPGMVKIGIHRGAPGNPDEPDCADHEGLKRKAMDFFGRTWPHLSKQFAITEHCIYTWTRNEDFILDQLPGTSVYVGAGFSGHGFKFGPVIGTIMADLATGQGGHVDMRRFKISQHMAKQSKM